MKILLVLFALLTPLSAMAAKKEFYDFCINIMPEMTRTSGLRSLTFAPFPPDGYLFAKVEGVPTLTCIYDAINGTTPVSVFAGLNLTNNKLEFKLFPKAQ